jgi:hypothetical protein
VTFPAERVMAALPPVGDKIELQPKASDTFAHDRERRHAG